VRFLLRQDEVDGACGEGIRLTLNMKRSGYLSNSFLRIVLLPEPLGPDMTMGFGSFFESVGAIVVVFAEALALVLRFVWYSLVGCWVRRAGTNRSSRGAVVLAAQKREEVERRSASGNGLKVVVMKKGNVCGTPSFEGGESFDASFAPAVPAKTGDQEARPTANVCRAYASPFDSAFSGKLSRTVGL
jgi:hypothetical protein